ncbi:hypothetical protein BGY98DRAFT_961617 [Russula aff. rugulosa BPL654]|nr:hypothetical protein BGY98DRAFT_961617 [Russula aff. rugulosa BPL654]
MDVFRRQAQAFDKFRKDDDKLMVWLTPVVNILFTFQKPSEPFSPAKTLFTGIGVLLGVGLFPHSLHVHSYNIQLRR